MEKVREYYKTHTRKDTAEHFGVSESKLRLFLKRHGLQRKSPGFYGDPITTKNRDTSINKFYKDPERTKQAKKKAMKTMEKRYGNPQYNLERAKATLIKKYGVSSYMMHEDFKTKSKDTMIKKYGVDKPLACGEILKKVQETNIERYGAPNVLSKESSLRKYRDERMIEKYGVKQPIQNETLKGKIKETLFERYGVDNPGLIHKDNYISKEEESLIPYLESLGLKHNENMKFRVTFSDGKVKIPDYYSEDLKVVLEYNGAYWHTNHNEPQYWNDEWSKIGYHVIVVWDFEYKKFIEDVKKGLTYIIQNYPSTFRNK